MIKTENATKYFNRGNPDEVLAVNDVSIEVKEGDFAVFKGPSGSGKTTLLSLIGCMSRPTSGRVTVEGRDVSRLPERFMTEVRRNTFGFIFQQFHLIKGISVCDNVMLPVLPTDIKPSELRQSAVRILENLGMSGRIDFPVQKLSGGEQQRAAIARALIRKPKILILDEVTTSLDPETEQVICDTLSSLAKEILVIVISHQPAVLRVAERLIHVERGRILGDENFVAVMPQPV